MDFPDGTIVVYPYHKYAIPHLDGESETIIQFEQRMPLHPQVSGILIQNLLRVIIDRLIGLDAEKPWAGNKDSIQDLRVVLARQEARALIESVKKGKIPEIAELAIGLDGHLDFDKLKP